MLLKLKGVQLRKINFLFGFWFLVFGFYSNPGFAQNPVSYDAWKKGIVVDYACNELRGSKHQQEITKTTLGTKLLGAASSLSTFRPNLSEAKKIRDREKKLYETKKYFSHVEFIEFLETNYRLDTAAFCGCALKTLTKGFPNEKVYNQQNVVVTKARPNNRYGDLQKDKIYLIEDVALVKCADKHYK